MNTVREPKLTPRRARKAKLMPIAREYRRKGYSLSEIGNALGVHYTTVWTWVKDIPPGDIYEGM